LEVRNLASTTNLIVSSAGGTGTRCAQFGADGTLSANASACGSGSSFAYPFTSLINFGTTTSATTTPIWAQNGIFASSTSYIASTTFAINGNVGIGTTSPLSKLAVSGGASIGADYNIAAPTNGLIVEGTVGIGTSSPPQLFTVGVRSYFADYVSIGSSTSATYPLDVQWSTGITRVLSTLGTNPAYTIWNNTAGNFLVGRESSSGTSIAVGTLPYASVVSDATANALQFGTTNNIRMTIAAGGNVGVGTSSPLSLFSVGTAGNAFRVDTTGAVKEGIWNGSTIAVANGGTGATTLTGPVKGNGTSAFTTYGTTGTGSVVLSDSPIITTNIQAPIYYDSNDTNYYLDGNSTSVLSTVAVIGAVTVGSYVASPTYYNSNGTYYLQPSSTSLLYGGNFVLNLLPNADGYYMCVGNGTYQLSYNSSCSFSDERMKTNIVDLSDQQGLAAIDKLRPFTFTWKDVNQQKVDPENLGLSAQAVQKIFPELVNQHGTSTTITLDGGTKQVITDPLGLDYSKLIVPVIKAVQELHALFLSFLSHPVFGSPQKPTGITLYDDADGSPYCVKVHAGQLQTNQGVCN
jgi:hypothetical protein